MYTIDGEGLPPPPVDNNIVPATSIRTRPDDTLESVYRRYLRLRPQVFGIDADAFSITLSAETDASGSRYIVMHDHGDGGPMHPVHTGIMAPRLPPPGRRAGIAPHLRLAFDNRLWRLRQAQARLNAIARTRTTTGGVPPAWSYVADEIVQLALERSLVEPARIVRAMGNVPFATRSMPVKRRRIDDPRRERGIMEDEEVREALPPMRGAILGGRIEVERMELGKGIGYDGHPAGAQISVPAKGDMPTSLVNGMVGMEIGRIVECDAIPGHLVITASRQTTALLQLTVAAPKLPIRLPPPGIGYDVMLR